MRIAFVLKDKFRLNLPHKTATHKHGGFVYCFFTLTGTGTVPENGTKELSLFSTQAKNLTHKGLQPFLRRALRTPVLS